MTIIEFIQLTFDKSNPFSIVEVEVFMCVSILRNFFLEDKDKYEEEQTQRMNNLERSSS